MTLTITVYSDGSCLGNPGPGGWAARIENGGDPIVLSGGESRTTNNRMELMAAISVLEWLRKHGSAGTTVTLVLDSEYVLKGMFEWLQGWQRKAWKNSKGQPVVNDDLWRRVPELLDAVKKKGVKLQKKWVKGHTGDPGNEFVDDLARHIATTFKI